MLWLKHKFSYFSFFCHFLKYHFTYITRKSWQPVKSWTWKKSTTSFRKFLVLSNSLYFLNESTVIWNVHNCSVWRKCISYEKLPKANAALEIFFIWLLISANSNTHWICEITWFFESANWRQLCQSTYFFNLHQLFLVIRKPSNLLKQMGLLEFMPSPFLD